jgi:alpha-tubulin suppressor-like RCC1 family protein
MHWRDQGSLTLQDDMEEEIMPVSVSCGAHHTAVITRRGDLITWGIGSSGQIGRGGHGDVRSAYASIAC